MNLRDAKDQIEREHPELTGTAKIVAIKELRERSAAAAKAVPDTGGQAGTTVPEDASAADQPTQAGVGEAWLALLLVAGGMRLLAWGIWGSFAAEPSWYDVLYAVLFVTAAGGLVSAYRRRGQRRV